MLTFVFTLLLFSPLSATRYPVVSKQDIGARVTNSVSITISTGTLTFLTFDTERYDTDGIHRLLSNTDRLTANTAGKYIITVEVRFDSPVVTGRRQIAIELNGTTIIAAQEWDTNQNEDTFMSITTIYDMAVTDFVRVRVFQSSGQNIDAFKSADESPEFSMQRIG